MSEELRNKILNVTFEKKNGEIRKMLCTLKEDLIPKVVGESIPRDGLITVYDLEKDGWRCFRADSVISVEEVPVGETKE